MAKHPNTPYVEPDTVRGVRDQGKRMLAMHFIEPNIMLIFLMRGGKGATVAEQFDWLKSILGLETFRKLFPVVLADNGSAFKRMREIEFTVAGERRTRVFYCDPQASRQKPHIEKNHEYIRYILPRGKSFNPYTQEDMVLLMNHINSTKRKGLGGRAPYELATTREFEKLMQVLKLHLLPADDVPLSPKLLKHKTED